jgi:hypothetical protein
MKGAKSGYEGRSASAIEAEQVRYNETLTAEVLGAVRRAGLDPAKVITHGTDLQGLMGMLMVGEIRPTARQHETPKLWGSYGVDVGVSYATTTGMKNGRPGVTVIMNNPTLKANGETLNRIPTVKDDFVAAVVTDGTKTIVLDKNALNALGGSASAWRDAAYKSAAGDMVEYGRWEALETKIVPQQ